MAVFILIQYKKASYLPIIEQSTIWSWYDNQSTIFFSEMPILGLLYCQVLVDTDILYDKLK